MRFSWILPGPRPGAKLEDGRPLIMVGCGGRGGGTGRSTAAVGMVVGTGVEVSDEQRDSGSGRGCCCCSSGAWPKAGLMAARFSGSPLMEISSSGKLMKKR